MDCLCGFFKCVSEARHKRGVASMKFSHFEAFPCLSAGGGTQQTNPQRQTQQIHSDIHREIHSSINRYPQLNPQLKRGGTICPPLWVPGRLKSIFVIPLFSRRLCGASADLQFGRRRGKNSGKRYFQNAYNCGALWGFINSVGRALDLDLLFCVVNPPD